MSFYEVLMVVVNEKLLEVAMKPVTTKAEVVFLREFITDEVVYLMTTCKTEVIKGDFLVSTLEDFIMYLDSIDEL